MPPGLSSEDDHGGNLAPTAGHQNLQGRVHSPMTPALTAVAVDGRRASSPSPSLRPASPVNRSFPPSSSRPSQLSAIANHSSKVTRFSDAFAGLAGRARTPSLASNSRRPTTTTEVSSELVAAESSFGIDADPFASHHDSSVGHASPSAAGEASYAPTSLEADNFASRRQRGSLLYAASDALGFGRVGASISRRMGKRNSVEQTTSPLQTSTQAQSRIGSLWKGKPKAKGHWALQPSSSTAAISDVIEISAAKSGTTSPRADEEENERKERERLREAAAESIGISPLFREEASSRYGGTDSHLEDESLEDDVSKDDNKASLEEESAEKLRSIDASLASVNGPSMASASLVGMPLQQFQVKESRHHRSSSLSVVGTGSPSISNWPLPRLDSNSIASNGIAASQSTPAIQPQLPPFPSPLFYLESFTRKASTVLKHSSSSLLALGLSRQWRPRFMVLTTPPQSKSPSSSNLRTFSPIRRPSSSYHLHLYKSSLPQEREIERLEVNNDSLAFISDEEIAGKRSVVKIVGTEVGFRKKDTVENEIGQTMWFLLFSDSTEAQSWIVTLKNAARDQKTERTAIGVSTLTDSSPGSKDDVMRSLRTQGLASTVLSYAHNGPKIPRPFANRATSPTPTIHSWSGEGRPRSAGRMVSLKGLFSVPSRTRSLSRQSTRIESPSTADEPTSFTSQGSALMDMMRLPNGSAISESAHGAEPSALSQPVPTVPTAPILSPHDMNLDQISANDSDRELPDWYPSQSHLHANGDTRSSQFGGPSLLPPPRSRRAWTSAGTMNHTRQEQTDEHMATRRSFQDSISIAGGGGGRLSVEEERRSHSPVDSIGTANGVFGNADKSSKRASLSSSVSSYASPPSDFGRSPSFVHRRARMSNIPKMLTPPTGPPPSVPAVQGNQVQTTRSIVRDNSGTSTNERPLSRSSSLRSVPNSEAMQSEGVSANRRMSDSSAFSVGSSSTSQSRLNALNAIRRSTITNTPLKRTSMPPPRPAPTFAPPPTPDQSSVTKLNGTAHRRSFRESFSPRSLRFSLTPPTTKGVATHNDDVAFRRRSLSNGGAASRHSHTPSPPVPPPTGPLPPTPTETPIPSRYSFRERLRMKSAPSSPGVLRASAGPPSSFPGSPPLVTVSSVASLKDMPPSPTIGEPITTIPKDLNFLNMAPPIEALETSVDDFLNMSPLVATAPMEIPSRSLKPAPLEHFGGSPPHSEMTVLPAPPRRARNGTISEKDRERSSQSLASSAALNEALPVNVPLGPVLTI